ncbi:Fic family protein [Bernardetia sp.]|uniref:Fic family protein n=1 Tax=Bernardetia sp. TaxID=1937974 RepID=UPI0025BACAEB|nr:Fic family protein [Bernardetia sp.]
MYIYQQTDYPNFTWADDKIIFILGQVRHLQGKVIGKMELLGFDLQKEATLETTVLDILKSTEIEGKNLDIQQIRSSVAKNLGVEIQDGVYVERDVEGVVEMILDATQNFRDTLTKERLFAWHASLFPTGRSGMQKIEVGSFIKDTKGRMQVVSGVLGKEKVHYEALVATDLEREINSFLAWLNDEKIEIDPILKAAIAHFWFLTIHPFEDGNGRIARAIADMFLARADETNHRFYSMSAQIRVERKEYYAVLEQTQKGTVDITNWLEWFLNCLLNALQNSDEIIKKVLKKYRFWTQHAQTNFNERQKLMLNKLLDNFYGKLTTSKWAKMTKCSSDTALRDINDLLEKNILKRQKAGGRSTSYQLNVLD